MPIFNFLPNTFLPRSHHFCFSSGLFWWRHVWWWETKSPVTHTAKWCQMYLTLSATPCVKPKRLRGKTYFSANVQATRQQQKVIYILSIRWMDSTPFAQLPPSSSSKDDQPHQNYNFYQYIPIVLFLQGMSWCLSCLWLCHFTKGKLSKPCQEGAWQNQERLVSSMWLCCLGKVIFGISCENWTSQ
jgi:hypothetical protein